MYRALTAIILGASCVSGFAQMTPVGTWRTIDDATGEAKSEVVITESSGVLRGRISKLLSKGADQNAVCDKCPDDRKDKPLIGLELMRGAKKAEGKNVWEGGKIVDPEGGTIYSLKLTPADSGKKLDVHAYVGMAFIGRTQTWVRIQ
ncbi:DUF2147 domain-containing protein [Polaromonas sp.]|uniref:DUF2147 domain-containing protein n=1 Tax=Polaromonas sp. TaxID=1869339 RepID=UPI0037537AA1